MKKNKIVLLVLSLVCHLIIYYSYNYFLFPFALSIIVIYICLEIPYLGNWGKYGDFSYGIYIWHFPIIQILIALHWSHLPPFVFLTLVITITSIFAALSWHLIEKPALRKENHYRQVEKGAAVSLNISPITSQIKNDKQQDSR